MRFPPTNLTLVSQTLASVVLRWGVAPQAATYNVYRDGKPIASGITALTYTDATVSSNKRYLYVVTGVVSGTETPQSNRLTVDVLAGTTLTFQSVFQEQPGEGGYPDILWRWQ